MENENKFPSHFFYKPKKNVFLYTILQMYCFFNKASKTNSNILSIKNPFFPNKLLGLIRTE